MSLLASLALGALLAHPTSDVFYEALHGTPVAAEGAQLLAAPGLYVGRPVRTRGRLERGREEGRYEITFARGRAVLRLEPEAARRTELNAEQWLRREVEVTGLVYRDASAPASHALVLRSWRLEPVGPAPVVRERPVAAGDAVSLEELVYSGGRYDGKAVRVQGRARGMNVHRDLPESTRKSARDWVLKQGHFAVWVAGKKPDQEDFVEVVGVPLTSRGVVRLSAQQVAPAPDAGTSTALAASAIVAPAPRLSFAYPIAAETLRADGRMILQFSRAMDAGRFAGGVKVRYERQGEVVGTPELALDYQESHRALIITPQVGPPAGSEVVVDLLDVVVDVSGRGLVARDAHDPVDGVVESVRFRAGS
jgi:hypothetical protein